MALGGKQQNELCFLDIDFNNRRNLPEIERIGFDRMIQLNFSGEIWKCGFGL